MGRAFGLKALLIVLSISVSLMDQEMKKMAKKMLKENMEKNRFFYKLPYHVMLFSSLFCHAARLYCALEDKSVTALNP